MIKDSDSVYRRDKIEANVFACPLYVAHATVAYAT